MIRRYLFWAHLGVGIASGAVVFVLCLTGAILAFELQLVNFAERDGRARPAQAGAELRTPQELAALVPLAAGERIVSLEWSADPGMPVRASTDRRNVVLLNGYTGALLGPGAMNLRAFMRWITAVHVDLCAQLTGQWAVALANVGLVFLITSGLWLWWPRQWRWRAFRQAMVPRLALSGKARDWNWHTTLGFWFLLPLLALAASGLVLSFPPVDRWWRGFAAAHLLDAAAPVAAVAVVADRPSPATTWSQWLALIGERDPGWCSLVLRGDGAPNPAGIWSCTVNSGTSRQRLAAVTMRLDTAHGQILEERRWANDDAPSRARAIARLGHSGEILGTTGQALAFIACLAGMVIVYTGFALSWRRFFKTRQAPTGSSGPPPAAAG
jgi:uncharacterized iron-regulated membrane protein